MKKTGEDLLIDWNQVRLFSITKEEWLVFTKACYETAKQHGFKPPSNKGMSLLHQAQKTVLKLGEMIKASPGSFHDLVSDAGVIPVLWVTGSESRKQFGKLIAAVKSATRLRPNSEQRKMFELAVEASSFMEKEARNNPEGYNEKMGSGPGGWPVLIDASNANEFPPTPKIVEYLCAQGSKHFFDLYRPRRHGAPDLDSAGNRIAGIFSAIALHLWGAKRLLKFDDPSPEVLKKRFNELEKFPGFPDFPGLKWFLLDEKVSVPLKPASKDIVTLIWQILDLQETDWHPQQIKELRALAGNVAENDTEYGIANRIRKEIRQRMLRLNPSRSL